MSLVDSTTDLAGGEVRMIPLDKIIVPTMDDIADRVEEFMRSGEWNDFTLEQQRNCIQFMWEHRWSHEEQPEKIDDRPVYFVKANHSHLVKIGVSENPASRFKGLQAASPEPLTLLGVTEGGGRELEKSLHERFADDRSHGEWFRKSIRLARTIEELTP